MAFDITPRSFWTFPHLQALTDDLDDFVVSPTASSGLSIEEDDTSVYVKAAVPGVDP